MRLTVSIDVDVPRRAVWDYLANPAHVRAFMAGMTRWTIAPGPPRGLGARYAMRMRVGPIELGGLLEIVEFDPPGELAWTSVTGIVQRGRWRLRSTGAATHVELRVAYHTEGGLPAALVDLVAAPMVQWHLRRALQALKRQVESRAGQRIPAAPATPAGQRAASRRRSTRRPSAPVWTRSAS